jgi:hypothetical protein
MGLSVTIGIPAIDLDDDDIRKRYESDFRLVNRLLKAAGVPSHRERMPASDWWQAEMGYGSLHFLRRFAAGIAVNGQPPVSLKKNARASTEPEIPAYREKRQSGEGEAKYDHLIFHSDAEGYYVPVDFPEVLNGNGAVPLTGGWLGSTVRLRQECEDLAGHLGLPVTLDFDLDDDAEWKRLKKATKGATWHGYPIEAFVCAVLLRASLLSVERRAAIVFG